MMGEQTTRERLGGYLTDYGAALLGLSRDDFAADRPEQLQRECADRILALLRPESATAERLLRDLLARIHRDGGQATDALGLVMAADSAERKVVGWLAAAPTERAGCSKCGAAYDSLGKASMDAALSRATPVPAREEGA